MNARPESTSGDIVPSGPRGLVHRAGPLIERGLRDITRFEQSTNALQAANLGDIFEAIRVGDVERVIAILAIDPSKAREISAEEETPLCEAVWSLAAEPTATQANATVIMALLLSSGADANAHSWIGAAPLTAAASLGLYDIATMLMDHGADVNARYKDTGETALCCAVEAGWTDMVTLLLEKGANPSRIGLGRKTPLDQAVEKNSVEIAAVLRRYGAKHTNELQLGPGDMPPPPPSREYLKELFRQNREQAAAAAEKAKNTSQSPRDEDG